MCIRHGDGREGLRQRKTRRRRGNKYAASQRTASPAVHKPKPAFAEGPVLAAQDAAASRTRDANSVHQRHVVDILIARFPDERGDVPCMDGHGHDRSHAKGVGLGDHHEFTLRVHK